VVVGVELSVRDFILAVLNAVLYAVVGVATHLGLFAFVVGGVRFWPSVFIPAVFAEVYGPLVGALGAAIGIFISDMVIHGNALISLSIGVPANFIGFYVLGCLARRIPRDSRYSGVLAVVLQFLPAIGIYYLYATGFIDTVIAGVFIGVVVVTAAIIAVSLATSLLTGRGYVYSNEALAYTAGLMIGSAYIGLGLWALTQAIRLGLPGVPEAFQAKAPIIAALIWFLWTYYTEIPFMVYLAPPVARAVEKWVKRYEEES